VIRGERGIGRIDNEKLFSFIYLFRSTQRWNNSSFWYLENKDYDDGYLNNKYKQDEVYYSWV
jgi:hypothetical protein